MDPVQLNVLGVQQLVNSPVNKTFKNPQSDSEGVIGNYQHILSLDLDDDELLQLANLWESSYSTYEEKLKRRQELNYKYYLVRLRFLHQYENYLVVG